MAQQQITIYTLSKNLKEQVDSYGPDARVKVYYDDSPPAGYEVAVIEKNGNKIIVCARPCTEVDVPDN